METRLAAELPHLVRLAQTNLAFAEYARWKAQAMALKNPMEFNELPVLLSNAVRLRLHGPKRPYITK
jgi:hypothetical protein